MACVSITGIGDPAASALLVLHGATLHARICDSVARGLVDISACIVRRPLGLRVTVQIKRQVLSDLAPFVDAVGLGRFSLVGHSIGG